MEKFNIEEFEKKTLKEQEELLKKKVDRPSARPMGIIYPKYIQRILDGENPVTKVSLYTTNNSEELLQEQEDKEEKSKIFEEIRKELNPFYCPECGKIMDKIDIKMFRLRKKCFLCNVKYERKIKELGLWEDYENKIITSNKISYLKDIREQTLDYVENQLKPIYEFVKEDGTIERWENTSYESIKEFLLNTIKEIDTNIEDLTQYLNELNQKLENLNKTLEEKTI